MHSNNRGHFIAGEGLGTYSVGMQFSLSGSQPIALNPSTQAQTYALFTLAMAVTLGGVFLGMSMAKTLLETGAHLWLVIVELALIFTSGWWSRHSPWNMILFIAFPLLSGVSITPYLLLVLVGFENGPAILTNAVAATVFISLSAVALARLAPGLSAFGAALFYSLIGLIVLTLLQFFVPQLRTLGFELALSGGAIVLFGLFTAFDIQRIQRMGSLGANPFLLALSLYLDIFNLFLSVLRFMGALSGDRR